MKQEKLCETEDMTDKDYSRYYADPVEQQKFNEDMGVENERIRQQLREAEILAAYPGQFKLNDKKTDEWEPGMALPKRAHDRQVAGEHYKRMDIQPWDVVDYGPKQQAIGFYRYNALKYIMRAGEKGDFKEDIAKAQHYLEKLLEIL